MSEDEIEIHQWPMRPVGGQHVGRHGHGVLLIHRPSGLAVVRIDERSQLANRTAAMKQLQATLESLGWGVTEEWAETWEVKRG